MTSDKVISRSHFYRVGGFPFRIDLPCGADADRMLPTFRDFKCGRGEDFLFSAVCSFADSSSVQDFRTDDLSGLEQVDCLNNDMGHIHLFRTADGYAVRLMPHGSNAVHFLKASADFASAQLMLMPDDPVAGCALSSMLKMIYSQAILRHQAFLLHASAVVLPERDAAYLFLGRSGTGKSTHSALWMKIFPGCSLLNDDNPVVRLEDGVAFVWGTPWSGKTPCYRNIASRIGGMARLSQSDSNQFWPESGPAAFSLVLPGCSVIRTDPGLFDSLCDTLTSLCSVVKIGRMACRPDISAAIVCRTGLCSGQ